METNRAHGLESHQNGINELYNKVNVYSELIKGQGKRSVSLVGVPHATWTLGLPVNYVESQHRYFLSNKSTMPVVMQLLQSRPKVFNQALLHKALS
jgi:hypothetical protein